MSEHKKNRNDTKQKKNKVKKEAYPNNNDLGTEPKMEKEICSGIKEKDVDDGNEKNIDSLKVSDNINKFNLIWGIVLGILTVGYPIANSVYNMIFQIKCEEFYHIPKKYFNENIDYKLLSIGLILLFFIIFTYPIIIKWLEDKRKEKSKFTIYLSIFWAVTIGGLLGCFNNLNCIYIMSELYRSDKYKPLIEVSSNYLHVIIAIELFFGLVSIVGITLIHEINSIKLKWIKLIIVSLIAVSLTNSIILTINTIIFNLIASPEDISRYEIVTSNSENYIVLSEYEDKILVVNYEIENEQLILKTNEYWFLDKFECTYNYIELSVPPVIEFQ